MVAPAKLPPRSPKRPVLRRIRPRLESQSTMHAPSDLQEQLLRTHLAEPPKTPRIRIPTPTAILPTPLPSPIPTPAPRAVARSYAPPPYQAYPPAPAASWPHATGPWHIPPVEIRRDAPRRPWGLVAMLALMGVMVGVVAFFAPSFSTAQAATWTRAQLTSATASHAGAYAVATAADAAAVKWQPSASNPRWDEAPAAPRNASKPEPRAHAASKRSPIAAAPHARSTAPAPAAKSQAPHPTSNEDAIELLKKELAASM